MAHYKISDVAVEVNERENNPANSQYERFVGLEHYVSGEVIIRNYGSTQNLESTMKIFKSGDVLVARRNVYLKRAATVDFDGLTSGDSIVLRAKNPIIGRILPFVLNTDEFWDFADQYSDGTMSKRLSPKTLMTYEFDLPGEEELESFADLLWTANDTRESYQELLRQTDELVKSQFIEMFGDPNELPEEALTTIGKLTTVVTGATPSRKRSDYYDGTIPWVKTGEIEQGIITGAEECITELAVSETNCKILPVNTIMLAMYGVGKTRGQSGILKIEAATNQACAAILPSETYDPQFLLYFLRNQYEAIRRLGQGTQQTNLNLSIVRGIAVPKASLAKQREYSAFVEQSDKSKFEIKKAIENTSALIKSLMQQDLSN